MKLGLIGTLAVTALFLTSTAKAYPTGVVFSPNGEAKPLGTVGALAYTGTTLNPSVAPGSSWFGLQTGLLPQWQYGSSGLSFGGLEAGFDIITPYGNTVKPVLNAKLGLVTEGTYSPSVALGMMEISPAMASMNYVYASGTKTLGAYGRLTFGFGVNAGSATQFAGTFPFHDTRLAIMAGYESPLLFDRVGLVADHLGGTSEISSTYLGVVFAKSKATTLAVGAFLANDRSVQNDGAFAYISTSFDYLKSAK